MSEECSEMVSDSSGFRRYRCTRKGPICEEGKPWCWQHAPSAVEKRRKIAAAREQEEHERRMARLEAPRENVALRKENEVWRERWEELEEIIGRIYLPEHAQNYMRHMRMVEERHPLPGGEEWANLRY